MDGEGRDEGPAPRDERRTGEDGEDPADFRPAWWLRGAHRQTVWGRLVRSRRLVPLRREALTAPDGDTLLLDHADAASFRARRRS